MNHEKQGWQRWQPAVNIDTSVINVFWNSAVFNQLSFYSLPVYLVVYYCLCSDL